MATPNKDLANYLIKLLDASIKQANKAIRVLDEQSCVFAANNLEASAKYALSASYDLQKYRDCCQKTLLNVTEMLLGEVKLDEEEN